MRFTQGQIRELLSIPVETFRTWRGAIQALTQHRGHGPTFTPGDVVAIAVIAELVRDYGVRISAVEDRMDKVVNACHDLSWLELDPCCIVVGRDFAKICILESLTLQNESDPILVVPCSPIIGRLRESLLAAEPENAQGHLQFPPAVIASNERRR